MRQPSDREIEAAIADVRACLTPDLLAPAFRTGAPAGIASWGHCAVAAEAVYFLLGGPKAGLTAHVVREDDGITHWWLQDRAGRRIDPTADQYTALGDVPPYARGLPGRGAGFMGQRVDPASPYGFDRRPSRRAAILLARVEALRAGRAPLSRPRPGRAIAAPCPA